MAVHASFTAESVSAPIPGQQTESSPTVPTTDGSVSRTKLTTLDALEAALLTPPANARARSPIVRSFPPVGELTVAPTPAKDRATQVHCRADAKKDKLLSLEPAILIDISWGQELGAGGTAAWDSSSPCGFTLAANCVAVVTQTRSCFATMGPRVFMLAALWPCGTRCSSTAPWSRTRQSSSTAGDRGPRAIRTQPDAIASAGADILRLKVFNAETSRDIYSRDM